MRSGWFWVYYAVGWTPYSAGLIAVFVANGAPFAGAVVTAHEYAIPAGLLGISVFPLCRRLSWQAGTRAQVMSVHLLGAAAFALLATAGALGLMSLERHRIVRPSFTILRFHFNANVLAYVALAGFAYAVDGERRLREEERRRSESELLRVGAELRTLRAQLNPHFLFNAIHSLIALTRQDSAAAEAGLEQLGALLRYSLREVRENEQEVLVKDEWAFVNDYLALEHLRLGDRLRVETCVDPNALDQPMLPVLLQPLVENAVRHAVASRAAGGRVSIALRQAGGALVFEVTDDGPGADPRSVERSPGFGLRSVRQRVISRYGAAASLSIAAAPGEGFVARVTIPARRKVEAAV
jgi:sensor histidine kinase YesM